MYAAIVVLLAGVPLAVAFVYVVRYVRVFRRGWSDRYGWFPPPESRVGNAVQKAVDHTVAAVTELLPRPNRREPERDRREAPARARVPPPAAQPAPPASMPAPGVSEPDGLEEILAATKVCPACAARVREPARVCRYCRYRFAAVPGGDS